MTREEAITRLKNMAWLDGSVEREQNIEAIYMAIEALTAEPKTGEWILTDFPDEQTYRCSSCNEHWVFLEGSPYDNGAYFCPNCGAKMGATGDRTTGKRGRRMKWTVYNKEKPQKVGSYLVTHTTDSGQYYVDYDFWTVYDEFKYHSTDVIAWMPFPKPYNKDEPQTETPTNRPSLHEISQLVVNDCINCEQETERNEYHRSRKVCTLELFDDDGVYIEPQKEK